MTTKQSPYSWTQPLCVKCWRHNNPGMRASTLQSPYSVDETCCQCGETTRSGIYVRVDPTTVKHPTRMRD